VVDGIQCARCGWHNEATAIMCGGCGQPLRAAQPAYQPPATVPWSQAPAAQPATPQRLSGGHDAPTWPAPGGWAPAAAAPAAPVARPRRSSCLSGCLWSLLITLALFTALAVGVWSLVLRPAIHAQADGALAKGIGALVASVPPIPEQALQIAGSKVTISEASSNDALRQLSGTAGIQNLVTVRYAPGIVRVQYDVRGNAGEITMQPRARDGRIEVVNVHVTGILGWIESGQELQATLNRELAPLSGKTPHGFAELTVTAGQVTVTLKTA
jgi:hypothetical protein